MAATSHYLVPLDLARQVMADIEQAANAIFAEYGLDSAKPRCKYGDRLTITLETVPTSSDESGINTNQPDAKAFTMLATSFGLEPTDLGKTFTFNGEVYTITGLKPRSTKFPVLATRTDGKVYKFPAATVRALVQR